MTTYNYTGAMENVNLAAGKYLLECFGAKGGGEARGGLGGYSAGEVDFSEGVTLHLFIGEHPSGDGGGFNGGGNSGGSGGYGGGGETDIRVNGTDIENRIMVAGSGGGQGATASFATGVGGAIIESGTPFQGGGAGKMGGGGGGGGYYGGGGAGWYNDPGAGGSSFVDSEIFENITMTPGVNEGHGYIVITLLSAPQSPSYAIII